MNRFMVPLVVLVVGILMIVLSVANVLPGLAGAGGGLVFMAILLAAFSFIRKPESVSDEREMSAVERLTNIFISPAEVFRNLRRHPRWLVALLVMSLLSSAYIFTFTQRLTPERIANFMSDKSIQMTESMGVQMPPEAAKKMREDNLNQFKNPINQFGTAVSGFVGFFVGFAFLAAIYLLITLAMGGQINFWQAFSVAVFAAFPVSIIHRLLSFVILFLKDPNDVHPLLGQQAIVTDNLGAFLNPADSPALWVLVSSIGVLSFYHLWLVATGLKNAGERVSSGTAWTAAIIVWVLGVGLGVLSSVLFPGFIS